MHICLFALKSNSEASLFKIIIPFILRHILKTFTKYIFESYGASKNNYEHQK